MERIILMVFRNILRVPGMWFKLCYRAAHPEKYSDEEHLEFLKYIVKRANIGGNVVIETYGTENLPEKNGYLITPNHQGLYDILAIVDAIPVPISVVGKKEIKDIPFIKQVFACVGAYPLDREDVRQAMQVIMNVTKDIKAGKNFVIFPEGTRSKNGNQIGEFKAGSFKAATRAKCPIVPVALIDSFKPFDSKSIKKTTVQVHFLKPLEYEEYKDMKTNEIAKIVEERIQKTINENVDNI